MIQKENIKKFIVYPTYQLKKILEIIIDNKCGFVLVVNKKLQMLGMITDGDIRRYLFTKGDINVACKEVMNKSFISLKSEDMQNIKKLIRENNIKQVPILDSNNKLKSVYILHEFVDLFENVLVVIMAGGEGKRIKNISGNLPKPMIKIGEKPVLEEIILYLKQFNLTNILLALNYKADIIKDYFKDGKQLGVNIKYVIEKKKLGTAGALSLISKEELTKNILVLNADVLTNINFQSFITFHREHNYLLSIAAKEYHVSIPFGIFNIHNGYVTDLVEKPEDKYFCNAGIYLIESKMLKYIPANTYFDMTDLIKIMIKNILPIGAFLLYEYWIDIGNEEHYRKAKKDLKSNKRIF